MAISRVDARIGVVKRSMFDQGKKEKKKIERRKKKSGVTKGFMDFACCRREFCGNTIHTNKYTPLSFLPVNLFEQFHRVAYLYFLLILILNQVHTVTDKMAQQTNLNYCCMCVYIYIYLNRWPSSFFAPTHPDTSTSGLWTICFTRAIALRGSTNSYQRCSRRCAPKKTRP